MGNPSGLLSTISRQLMKPKHQPIEICNPLSRPCHTVVLPFFAVNLATSRREHNLHMQECNRHRLRIEELWCEDFMEVCRDQNLRTIGAAIKERSENATKESSTIFRRAGEYKVPNKDENTS